MSPRTTSKVTTDHGEIRRWAEERGGQPAAVRRTDGDDDAGIIRLEFSGAFNRQDDGFDQIGWDEWLRKFDENSLAFLYQEQTANGENSNFNRVISRETAEEAHRAMGGKGRSATPKRAATSATKASRSHTGSGEQGREETTKRVASARGGAASSARVSTRNRAAERGPASSRRDAVNRRSEMDSAPISTGAGVRRASSRSRGTPGSQSSSSSRNTRNRSL